MKQGSEEAPAEQEDDDEQYLEGPTFEREVCVCMCVPIHIYIHTCIFTCVLLYDEQYLEGPTFEREACVCI